jgi:4-diphosphocytidyl-2-C-methyl-D-erythritol kinase
LIHGKGTVKKVRILSPAKINYHLDVGRIREDGFHEILSLFQAVSLYDEMEWSLTEHPGECRIEGNFPCAPEDNLIYKANREFRSATGFEKGVRVVVDKRIPHEAGLGGGSSNAAAALKALCKLSGIPLSLEKKVEIAANLGSDVPFFFYSAAASVSGRGDVVEPVAGRTDFCIVLTKPDGLGISTARAYAEVDRWKATVGTSQSFISKEDMIQMYEAVSPGDWAFFNSFFETFKKEYKPLEFISNLLYDAGAVFTGLSGSGSSLFGIFLSQAGAENAERLLGEYFPFVERIMPLDSIPGAYGI